MIIKQKKRKCIVTFTFFLSENSTIVSVVNKEKNMYLIIE